MIRATVCLLFVCVVYHSTQRTIADQSKGFISLGCFTDKPSRAISGGYVSFPASTVIDQCYQRALKAGNKIFAVQANTQCFTSQYATKTYDKYGETSGCSLGRGGNWKQNVYKIPKRIRSDLYRSVGCFNDKSSRAISGGYTNFPPSTIIEECYQRALKAGNEFFAVQSNNQCFTSPNAGQTYEKYGRTSGCSLGRGGVWKQNVYQIQRGTLADEEDAE